MGKAKGFEEIPLIEGSLGHVKGLTYSPALYAFCTKGVMIYKGSVYRRCWTAHTGVEKSFVGLCELGF